MDKKIWIFISMLILLLIVGLTVFLFIKFGIPQSTIPSGLVPSPSSSTGFGGSG